MKNPMDYKYKDQPFSQEIAEAILAEVWTSNLSIPSIRKELLDLHWRKSCGLGLPDLLLDSENIEADSIVREALKNLSKKAMTSRIHDDIWRIAKPDQWIFGTGKHWIYLYYFPQEKRDAEEKGRSVFSCKIGKADGLASNSDIKYDAPEKRVEFLTRGAREFAKIPLLLRTDSHTTLETAIHKHLELQRNSIRERPSKEWFFTNPREVVKIVGDINLDLLSPVNVPYLLRKEK